MLLEGVMVTNSFQKILILFCLFLPACGPFSKKIKKSSRYPEDSDSIFVPISEEEVRNDVRKQYISDFDETDYENKKPIRMSRKQKKLFVAKRVEEKEAKLIDVPLLLNAEPIQQFFLDQEGDMHHNELGYNVDLSKDEVIQFYLQGMERNGWRVLSQADGVETLISFVKPDRFCSISVRPKKTGVAVVLFSGTNRSGS